MGQKGPWLPNPCLSVVVVVVVVAVVVVVCWVISMGIYDVAYHSGPSEEDHAGGWSYRRIPGIDHIWGALRWGLLPLVLAGLERSQSPGPSNPNSTSPAFCNLFGSLCAVCGLPDLPPPVPIASSQSGTACHYVNRNSPTHRLKLLCLSWRLYVSLNTPKGHNGYQRRMPRKPLDGPKETGFAESQCRIAG